MSKIGKNYSGFSAYVGDIARSYDDDRISEEMWRLEDSWLTEFLSNIPKDSAVVDLPVGTGRFIDLYKKLNLLKVTGIDASKDMIAVAEQKKILCKHPIDLIQGSSESINLADKSVNYLVCFRLFHLLPNNSKSETLKEFARVVNGLVLLHVYTNILIPDEPLNKTAAVSKSNFIKVLLSKVLTIGTRLKMLFHGVDPKAKEQTPWAHIQNYPCGFNQLDNMIRQAGLKIENISLIGESTRSPARIYLLRPN